MSINSVGYNTFSSTTHHSHHCHVCTCGGTLPQQDHDEDPPPYVPRDVPAKPLPTRGYYPPPDPQQQVRLVISF